MRRTALLIAAALFLVAPAAEAKTSKAAREPVVVELFTAQGCSDCPQANELLAKLAEEPGVIALTFPVDYWDYLGWRDTFAKPEFTLRQRAYKTAMKLRDVYTPQIVIDGTRQLPGGKADDVVAAVKLEARRHDDQPSIALTSPKRVRVGAGKPPRGGAVVWLVRYDPEVRDVTVKTGENKGLTIKHANTVRQLVKLGEWRGEPRRFRLPDAPDPDLKTVVLVQAGRGGRIVGAKAL